VTDRITVQFANASASVTWEGWMLAPGAGGTCFFNLN